MGNFAYRQVLKGLSINGLGPTAHAEPKGAGGTERRTKPHFHALQASDAPFLVDEEIVTGAQEFVFV